MRSRESLEKLAHLSRYQEQLKSTELSARLAEQRQAEERLRQLRGYLADYQRRDVPRSVADLRNHRQFMLNLSIAIATQERICQDIEIRLKPVYRSWMTARKRSEAVEESVEDARRQEAENEEKARQKDLEVHASRNYLKKRQAEP